MTDQALTAAPPRLHVGHVLARSFELLLRDFGKFFLLSAIVWLPTFGFSIATRLSTRPNGFPLSENAIGAWWIVTWLILSVFGHAVILDGAFQRLCGKSFALGRSLRRAVARFFPMIGVIVCYSLGVGFASLLLVVPGMIVFLMWYVAVPACLLEELGPIASLRQSRALTKGNRWRILGLTLILSLAGGGAGLILAQFGFAVFDTGTGTPVVVFLSQTILSAYREIALAVIYHDLRVAREGVDLERVAAVFD
ncbi:MAG TPA: hypothetical protein VN668_21910 [Stellaceae bacterium]|nr:hypothetical protein [Stellaceae bacterium]